MRLISLRGKRFFWGTVLILLSILIVLTIIAFTPTNNLSTKNIAPTPKTVDLCASFPKVQGEISCQDAINVVLEKYPGKITKIDKKTLSIPIGRPPAAVKFEAKSIWLISIVVNRELSFPKGGATKVLDIGVDVKEEKILITYPKFKK